MVIRRWFVPVLLALSVQPLFAETYAPPATPREKLDFNADWKFIKEDVSDAAKPSFDDSKWAHAFIGDPPALAVSSQLDTPVQIVETVQPKTVTPSNGGFEFDMGQNMV